MFLMQKNKAIKGVLCFMGFLVCVLIAPSYAGKVELFTYLPGTYGEFVSLTTSADCYFATSSGNVGIGTTSPSVKLDVAQNNAIKVGQAYLSSGITNAEAARLATNEWYNGSAWVTNGSAGILLELYRAQGVYVYYHSAAGAHTGWANITSTSGWAAGCSQIYKQNIQPLTVVDYVSLRDQFRKIDLFSYNRKDTPMEPEVGFILEHSPELILSHQEKAHPTIPYIKVIGYLAAILKAQEIALDGLEKELQMLRHDNRSLKDQQRQNETLREEVLRLKTRFGLLKQRMAKKNMEIRHEI